MLNDADIRAFEPDAKIALLATSDAGGLPRLSLITTIQAKTSTSLMWGQFCEGESKQNVQRRPKTGFLVMNAERELWRGKARWTGLVREGEDYELYNHRPIYRYNTYFGIHTVHYMDLVSVTPKGSLSLPRIGVGAVGARLAAPFAGKGEGKRALSSFSRELIGGMATLRFLSFVGEDGFPWIVPVVPAHPASDSRLVIAATVYRDELERIPQGASVALFAMNMDMQSVLVRGSFSGVHPCGTATLDVDWVYNSMPPLPGVVFPRPELKAVRDFGI